VLELNLWESELVVVCPASPLLPLPLVLETRHHFRTTYHGTYASTGQKNCHNIHMLRFSKLALKVLYGEGLEEFTSQGCSYRGPKVPLTPPPPPFFLSKHGKNVMTIWWVYSLWHSVTPIWKILAMPLLVDYTFMGKKEDFQFASGCHKTCLGLKVSSWIQMRAKSNFLLSKWENILRGACT